MTEKIGKNKYRNMRNILDSSWATFVNMLQIKVLSTESEIIFVNPKNTSKMCSCCGNIKEDLQLWDRTYNCNKCNLSIDRDYNASVNIYRRGKELTFVGGDTSVFPMKQESSSFMVG
ncbi:MAG: zinc ribbon domain-containing protein [Atribacterota bacterium]